MEINQNAPLYAKQGILINAPIEKVWAVQSNLIAWPTWQKGITEISIEGELQKGSVFHWKAKGLAITSQIQEFTPLEVIGWTGISFGMKAAHYWYFTQVGNQTKVTTEEALSSWMPRLIKIFSPDFLQKSLVTALETLKAESES